MLREVLTRFKTLKINKKVSSDGEESLLRDSIGEGSSVLAKFLCGLWNFYY